MNQPPDTQFPGGQPVQQAYDGLAKVEPTAEMDRAILKYARAASRTQGRRWVWPVSLAAGVLVTLGIVTQMARIVPSGSYPRSPIAEVAPREPRSAAASGEFDQSGDLQVQSVTARIPGRSADAWIEHLQSLADNNQPQAFFQALTEAREDYPALDLPVGLRRQIQDWQAMED